MKHSDELVRLKLRQARRKEIPHKIVKWSVLVFVALLLWGLTENCGRVTPQPKSQAKKDYDAMWTGDQVARNRRIP